MFHIKNISAIGSAWGAFKKKPPNHWKTIWFPDANGWLVATQYQWNDSDSDAAIFSLARASSKTNNKQ